MPPIVSRIDRLVIERHPDRAALGAAAGTAAAGLVRGLLAAQPEVRMIVAAAPSQRETLATLVRAQGIDWSRVTAFHMDEYVGLDPDAPQRFGRFLEDQLFGLVRPGRVHLLDGNAEPAAECRRYSALLAAAPIDVVCLGIGENGHIAFNDPPVADFHDPVAVKLVGLDAACRRQQVNDGCFAALDLVPTHALSLTIPALMAGRHLVCAVPGPTKRAAVARLLSGSIGTDCPATILRTHPDCTLHVDAQSLPDA